MGCGVIISARLGFDRLRKEQEVVAHDSDFLFERIPLGRQAPYGLTAFSKRKQTRDSEEL
jgi:hypothetical protein